MSHRPRRATKEVAETTGRAVRRTFRPLQTALLAWVALLLEGAVAVGVESPSRVVIPFDFTSKFDDGRYGRLVGDQIWKKLEREGSVVIPESMQDVRDWSERRKMVPSAATPLEEMRRIVRDDFGGDIGIWGTIERVPGNALDVYDFAIRVADFSVEPPRLIFEKSARTQTVSEIPHVHVKAALDKLFDRPPPLARGPDPEAEQLWKTGPNLVQGSFDLGARHPDGWEPLPAYVRLVALPTTEQPRNRAVRFEFPEEVAGAAGVLYYSDYFPVEEGATYRFQVRWRTTGSAVKVFIKCYDEFRTKFAEGGSPDAKPTLPYERREVYRSQQNLNGPAKQWNLHTEEFTPRHTAFSPRWGRVMLYAYWPAGTVDFDDVVVKQIKPAPPSVRDKVRRPSTETRVLQEEFEKTRPR